MQKIITTQSFQVIGIKIRTSKQKAMKDISKLWKKFISQEIKNKVPNKLNEDIFAVYTDYAGNYMEPYSYILGCAVSSLDVIPDAMIGIEISSAQYEIFTAKGKMPDKIIETWQRIWDPEIDFRRSYIADFELYGPKYSDPDNPEVEIYVGIK